MCDPATGKCTPANVGTPCDDRNPCTPESGCEAVDIPGLGMVGLCQAGTAIVATPTATESASAPTPTPMAEVCAGDCSGDGVVTVDELITGATIALGERATADCPSFDEIRNDRVEVDELLGAIRNAQPVRSGGAKLSRGGCEIPYGEDIGCKPSRCILCIDARVLCSHWFLAAGNLPDVLECR